MQSSGNVIKFKGRVLSPRTPPPSSETEIFETNPQRADLIMNHTKWPKVFPGTLNLRVEERVFEKLSDMEELFYEHPDNIDHPSNPDIPRKRRGYYYYRAKAYAKDNLAEVLVRRAGNPHDKGDVALVAEEKLMDRLQIKEKDMVEVVVVIL